MPEPSLKSHLYRAYGGFADKRIKDLSKSDRFIIDDRNANDFNAKKHLYPYFCLMLARVLSSDTLEITLRGNIPTSARIEHWVANRSVIYKTGAQHELTITIRLGQEAILEELASLMDDIVRPGGLRYSVPSYKYVCPRTSRSLRRLVETLRDFSSS